MSTRSSLELLMVCEVLKIEYDFKSHRGLVTVHEGDCTDMTGAIKTFYAMDKDVEAVLVVAGGLPSVEYVRDDSAKVEELGISEKQSIKKPKNVWCALLYKDGKVTSRGPISSWSDSIASWKLPRTFLERERQR